MFLTNKRFYVWMQCEMLAMTRNKVLAFKKTLNKFFAISVKKAFFGLFYNSQI